MHFPVAKGETQALKSPIGKTASEVLETLVGSGPLSLLPKILFLGWLIIYRWEAEDESNSLKVTQSL